MPLVKPCSTHDWNSLRQEKGETIQYWYSDNNHAGGIFSLILHGLNPCKLLGELIREGGRSSPVCREQGSCMCPRGTCVTHLIGGSYRATKSHESMWHIDLLDKKIKVRWLNYNKNRGVSHVGSLEGRNTLCIRLWKGAHPIHVELRLQLLPTLLLPNLRVWVHFQGQSL